MKTPIQIAFDELIKNSFHSLLKPLKFKKKSLNFYRDLSEIGHIIQIQKSQYSSSMEIKFTINISIFEPIFYLANRTNKVLPNYPTEPDCIIRKRISDFVNKIDHWFILDENTDLVQLESTLKNHVINDILPFFEKYHSLATLKAGILNQDLDIHPYAQMIFFAEHHDVATAKYHYQQLLKTAQEPFLSTLHEQAKYYQLIE